MTSAFDLNLLEKLKASQRKPSIYGYRPHTKQEMFHASRAKGTIFIGGNRSGKTVGGSVECLRAATGTDPHRKYPEPPLRIRACTVDLKQGVQKIILPELARWCPPSALINQSWEESFNKTNLTLTLNNGSFIEILTYEQDVEKHAGTSRHLVWFDEEPPEEIFSEDIARLIDTGGIWKMTMTPVEGLEWIFQLYQEVEVEGNPNNRDVIFVQVDSYENVYINGAEIDALFFNLTPEQKLARTRGMFTALGDKIYKNLDRIIIDMSDAHFPLEWPRIEGMDSGIRNPTAWLWATIDPIENIIYIRDEFYKAGLSVAEVVPNVIKKTGQYGHPLYRVADSSVTDRQVVTGQTVQYEYSKHGVYLVPADKGPGSVLHGINKLQQLFGQTPDDVPAVYISDTCEHLVRELKKYRWANYAHRGMEATRNKKQEPVKKDDHAADALRYLCMSWHEWGPEIPPEKQMLVPASIPLPSHVPSGDGWDYAPATNEDWEETMHSGHSILGGEW